MLGGHAGVTDTTVLQYLGIVEQRTNELLQLQAFIQAKVITIMITLTNSTHVITITITLTQHSVFDLTKIIGTIIIYYFSP